MSDIAVQASFNSGEWSPALFARVDVQKYRSGAALLENFFVDYRGGASTRAGTQYIILARDWTHPVRLIPFQAAFNIGYILEFGQGYVRFIYQGSPVLENPFSITAATNANPCVITVPGHDYIVGDWIFVSGVGGMTQLNGRYYGITNVAGNDLTLTGIPGGPIDSTGYGTYTSGGTAQRIYTIASPYFGADLALLKFTQTTTEMILCHPNHPPYVLTLVTAINWTLAPISFGSTVGAPTLLRVATSLPNVNIYTTPYTFGQSTYGYGVSSVDSTGQESAISNIGHVGPVLDIRNYPGTNAVYWSPVAGAQYYNVYETNISYFGVQPPGVQFGYIGYATKTSFIDDNIGPDFAQGPQIVQNPFVGSGINFVTVTAFGTYTTVPTINSTGGTPAVPASYQAHLGANAVPTITAGGTNFSVGDTISFGNGIVLTVLTLSGSAIASWAIASIGDITSGSTPSNPIAQINTSGTGTGATATVTWGVVSVQVVTPGAGYSAAPTLSPSTGAATFVATLGGAGNGNPAVPWFFQQRLGLGGSPASPGTFYLSQPGSYFNFNITNPIRADNAISETLVSNTLNSIKSAVSVPAGLMLFTDKAIWIINGGYVSQGISAAVTPTTIIASEHSYEGANDMPPIAANYDFLFVESKSSKVRDVTYNIYYNIFTGTDISITASHLFFGYNLTEWTWAEEPFYTVQAVRDDGTLLTLTFLKEQDFIAWTHQVTAGQFTSVASVTEPEAIAGNYDAVYVVVERVVEGTSLKYIERFAERVFPAGLEDAWCVDCALKYSGTPTASFQGAEQLAGLTVTGLADGAIITPFVMPATGFFTLPAPASKVILGLGFTCKLQTLPLDLGEPSVQGKVKKIPAVDIRVNETLGLTIGSDFSHQTVMKDLVQGNVSSQLTGQSTQIVSGLYTGDARTFLDPTYTVPGQYCIQQSNPYPASVLGVFPLVVIGDDR